MKLKYINRLCENSGVNNINNVTEEMLRHEIGAYFGRDKEYEDDLRTCLIKVSEGKPIVSVETAERIKQDLWIKAENGGGDYEKKLKKYRYILQEGMESPKNPDSNTKDQDKDEGEGQEHAEESVAALDLSEFVPVKSEVKEPEDEFEKEEPAISKEALGSFNPTVTFEEKMAEPAEHKKEKTEETEEWGDVPAEDTVSILDWFTTIIVLIIPGINIGAAIFWLISKDVPKSRKNYIIAFYIMLLTIILVLGGMWLSARVNLPFKFPWA